MTNAHNLYRQWQGRTGHLGPLQMANLLRKQALLAHHHQHQPQPWTGHHGGPRDRLLQNLAPLGRAPGRGRRGESATIRPLRVPTTPNLTGSISPVRLVRSTRKQAASSSHRIKEHLRDGRWTWSWRVRVQSEEKAKNPGPRPWHLGFFPRTQQPSPRAGLLCQKKTICRSGPYGSK